MISQQSLWHRPNVATLIQLKIQFGNILYKRYMETGHMIHHITVFVLIWVKWIFWIFSEFFEFFKPNFEDFFPNLYRKRIEKQDYCLIWFDSRCGVAIFRFPLKMHFWWCCFVHVSEHVSKKRFRIFRKNHDYLLIGLDSGHGMTIFGFTLKFRFQWYIHVHI